MNIMRKIIKLLVQAFFWSWVLRQILPPILAEYKPIEWYFGASGHLNNAMTYLAIGLFLFTLIPVKQKSVAEKDKTTLILHDLDPETAREIFSHIPNTKFYCASPKMAPCKGYYDCWLRTPGTCALHDGFEGLGQQIGACDEFIIVSKNLYGGYSKEIKNALDRSISFALPYFKMVAREVHHQERYRNMGSMTVYIHDSENISDYDKNAIRELAKANIRNLNKNEPRVEFIVGTNEIKELAA